MLDEVQAVPGVLEKDSRIEMRAEFTLDLLTEIQKIAPKLLVVAHKGLLKAVERAYFLKGERQPLPLTNLKPSQDDDPVKILDSLEIVKHEDNNYGNAEARMFCSDPGRPIYRLPAPKPPIV